MVVLFFVLREAIEETKFKGANGVAGLYEF